MCYDDNARPPIPEGPAGEASGEDLVLTAADGNRFSAFIARPVGTARATILIYPDIRGLHQFYKELALRFAEQGIAALAIDYFGRTAGLTARDESFEFRPHVQQMQTASVLADTTAGLDYLRTVDGVQGASFIVGFCLGGSLALFAATRDLGLAGSIPFYAGLSRVWDEQGRTVLEAATDTRTPVLGLFGGADQGIPVDQVEMLDRALDDSGAEHEIRIYPGAPHSFFDRRAHEFAEASADAWKRILDFVIAHTSR
jgi:carboxymethylenebutenolidase